MRGMLRINYSKKCGKGVVVGEGKKHVRDVVAIAMGRAIIHARAKL